MSRLYNLQCRSPQGVIPLRGLESTLTLGQLKELIFEKTQISPNEQKILSGFPPKEIVIDNSVALQDSPIKNGDTLVISSTGGSSGGTQPPTTVNMPLPVTTPNKTSTSTPPSSTASSTATAAAAPSSAGGVRRMSDLSSNVSHPTPKDTSSIPGALYDDDPNTDDGILVRRVVHADNSCLFNSVGFVLENHSRTKAPDIRTTVANYIKSHPEEYTEALLGKSPEAYANWIQDSKSWGGAIELAILAQHYQTEICAFDIQTTRQDIYGQDKQYHNRVLLIYDGIHYDPLALTFAKELPEDMDQTIFGRSSQLVMDKAIRFVKSLHQKRQFTNTTSFTLRCITCGTGLEGEAQAREHAKKTQHVNFSEY